MSCLICELEQKDAKREDSVVCSANRDLFGHHFKSDSKNRYVLQLIFVYLTSKKICDGIFMNICSAGPKSNDNRSRSANVKKKELENKMENRKSEGCHASVEGILARFSFPTLPLLIEDKIHSSLSLKGTVSLDGSLFRYTKLIRYGITLRLSVVFSKFLKSLLVYN
jgi:hypothetical protein